MLQVQKEVEQYLRLKALEWSSKADQAKHNFVEQLQVRLLQGFHCPNEIIDIICGFTENAYWKRLRTSGMYISCVLYEGWKEDLGWVKTNFFI